jgi:hypothetical protein
MMPCYKLAAQYLDGKICKFMQFLYKSSIAKCPSLVPHGKPFSAHEKGVNDGCICMAILTHIDIGKY